MAISCNRPRPPSVLRGATLAALAVIVLGAALPAETPAAPLELAGTVVVSHAPTIAADLRYAAERGPTDGARVQLFVLNDGTAAITLAPDTAITVGGTTPDALVASGAWSWHDFPSQWPGEPLELPPAGLTVLALNAAGGGWGAGTVTDVTIAGHAPLRLDATPPDAWISSITFLRRAAAEGVEGVHPDTLVVHVENGSDRAWSIRECRLWTPRPGGTHRALFAGGRLEGARPFPADGTIPPGQSGGLVVPVADLPLSYAAVELGLFGDGGVERSLWGHVRVKRERFAIGGGWVDSSLPAAALVGFVMAERKPHENLVSPHPRAVVGRPSGKPPGLVIHDHVSRRSRRRRGRPARAEQHHLAGSDRTGSPHRHGSFGAAGV